MRRRTRAADLRAPYGTSWQIESLFDTEEREAAARSGEIALQSRARRHRCCLPVAGPAPVLKVPVAPHSLGNVHCQQALESGGDATTTKRQTNCRFGLFEVDLATVELWKSNTKT